MAAIFSDLHSTAMRSSFPAGGVHAMSSRQKHCRARSGCRAVRCACNKLHTRHSDEACDKATLCWTSQANLTSKEEEERRHHLCPSGG